MTHTNPHESTIGHCLLRVTYFKHMLKVVSIIYLQISNLRGVEGNGIQQTELLRLMDNWGEI